MRWAKSYSIVDHAFLHEGYFQRLSHPALSLYLFLVVVGDRQGKSFYAPVTIQEILRLSAQAYRCALAELCGVKLITVRVPYFWVNNLGRPLPENPVPPRDRGTLPSTNCRATGNLERPSFSDLLQTLSGVRR